MYNSSESHQPLATIARNRLTKSIKHIQKYWIPVNPDALANIQEGFKSNRYLENRQILNQDLKSDIALYTWCIKKICQKYKKESVITEEIDPIKILEEIELDEIKKLLDISTADISKHNINESNIHQISVLQDTMLGASAAEVAANAIKGDKRAFGATVLRQLGHALIAWNYETIYQEAASLAQEKQEDIDTTIAQKLGFSPELLATCIVQSWGVSQKKCYSIGLKLNTETGKHGDIKPSNNEQELLWKVCELGEKLAKANSTLRYPKSKTEWLKVQKQLEEIAGKGVIAVIRNKFEDYCQYYLKQIPGIITNSGSIFNFEKFPSSLETTGIMKNNQYINKCDPQTRFNLRKLYEKLERESNIDQLKIQLLIRELIPAAGFSGGAVFMFEPTLNKLIAQLYFGKIQLISLKAVDYTLATTNAKFIAAAFQASEYKQEIKYNPDEVLYLSLAGPLGKSRRIGVFYLEGPQQNGCISNETICHFKAFRQCLADCLKLT